MNDAKIQESIEREVNTIRKPSKLATGDAVAMLIGDLIRQSPDITSKEIIVLLQESGFHAADGLKDFIEAQLKQYRGQ